MMRINGVYSIYTCTLNDEKLDDVSNLLELAQ